VSRKPDAISCEESALVITATERALETLSTREQTELLQLVIKTIRALQVSGAIAPQRMCVTCQYFRPNTHKDPHAPHHCAYVDAAFGAEGLADRLQRA